MFFSMSKSPGTFQCFMNHILEPWYKKYGYKEGSNYMDDIGIGTLLKDKEKHIMMIYNLFDILAKHGLHLKLSKSTFMQLQMDFLGVRILKDGVTVDRTQVAGLGEWPQEIKNIKGACSFIGVIGYHHMFVPNFSEITTPITKLFRKDVDFTWEPEQ